MNRHLRVRRWVSLEPQPRQTPFLLVNADPLVFISALSSLFTEFKSQDVVFPREFLVSIGRDVDSILNKALTGVDSQRAAQLNALFLQLHQLGETIRAENRVAEGAAPLPTYGSAATYTQHAMDTTRKVR